ncbi:MAG: peptidylprolyl isomerase [Gammaproteobacteria bacterium]|nr:MAG: peptidylprolyl isomerase [Gammaproteobacteria bacterium]
MKIENNKVVNINYKLTDDQGNVIDESNDGSFAYLHGANNIIPGLEKALEGKDEGEKLSVSVSPAEGYGERDEQQIQEVPREMFPQDIEIQPGMNFHAQTPDGTPVVVTVTAVGDDTVTVDGNHPLAGQNLNFEVEIVSVRDAQPEELEHGHVHG